MQCIDLLIKHGYAIKHTRFKRNTGEIDIVAIKDDILHMFEVKYRQSMYAAKESVIKSYQRMYNTYAAYLYDLYPHLEPRFRYCAICNDRIVIDDIDYLDES